MNNQNFNSGITLVDVRSEAMDTIKKLKNKELDVPTAREIKGLLDVVVNVAKTQVEFIKALPDDVKKSMKPEEVKAIAGTLKDRDAELDQTLHAIEEKSKVPYQDQK